MTDEMFLVDMNGHHHPMTSRFVTLVLISGWVFFIQAILVNCFYYVLHPMGLKVSPMAKLKTQIFGHQWNIKEPIIKPRQPDTVKRENANDEEDDELIPSARETNQEEEEGVKRLKTQFKLSQFSIETNI